jgi:hypothetical protein
MKMKPEHYQSLKHAIDAFLEAYPEIPDRYRNGDYPNADRTKELNRRFRWDLFWAVRHEFDVELWDYLLDEHIDTALRRIVPEL